MSRILHVVTAWPRDADDVITPWLVTLCERQAARGHDVEVLAPSWRGLRGGTEAAVTVRRFRYAPARWERLTHEEATPDRLRRHPGFGLLIPGYLMAGTLAGWRIGRRRDYDVVHVHWAIPHGPFGRAAARAAGATLVTTFYGAEIRWAESTFPPGIRYLRRYCERSRLVAISESTRRMVARLTDRPVTVVPYGVPLPPADPEDGASTDGPPTLLFVGRLVARKGVDRLLEALATIRDRPWRLEVVGFGPERGPLEALTDRLDLDERVAFLGRVSDRDLARAYRKADLFVLPATLDDRNDTEGLGVVLLEAMAHAIPVVATRRGGIPDIVIDGETGLLVEDAIEPLASAIASLLGDAAIARAMGERGRERVAREFSWETILDRLDAVYGRPIDRPGG